MPTPESKTEHAIISPEEDAKSPIKEMTDQLNSTYDLISRLADLETELIEARADSSTLVEVGAVKKGLQDLIVDINERGSMLIRRQRQLGRYDDAKFALENDFIKKKKGKDAQQILDDLEEARVQLGDTPERMKLIEALEGLETRMAQGSRDYKQLLGWLGQICSLEQELVVGTMIFETDVEQDRLREAIRDFELKLEEIKEKKREETEEITYEGGPKADKEPEVTIEELLENAKDYDGLVFTVRGARELSDKGVTLSGVTVADTLEYIRQRVTMGLAVEADIKGLPNAVLRKKVKEFLIPDIPQPVAVEALRTEVVTAVGHHLDDEIGRVNTEIRRISRKRGGLKARVAAIVLAGLMAFGAINYFMRGGGEEPTGSRPVAARVERKDAGVREAKKEVALEAAETKKSESISGTIEKGEGPLHAVDRIIAERGKDLFPGWGPKEIHTWKVMQMKQLGIKMILGFWGYPFTVHPGAEVKFVRDAGSLGGYKVELAGAVDWHPGHLKWGIAK